MCGCYCCAMAVCTPRLRRLAERERTAPQAKLPAGRGFRGSAPNYSKQNPDLPPHKPCELYSLRALVSSVGLVAPTAIRHSEPTCRRLQSAEPRLQNDTARNTTRPQHTRAHSKPSAVENGASGSCSGSDCSATQHAHNTPTRTTSPALWRTGGLWLWL